MRHSAARAMAPTDRHFAGLAPELRIPGKLALAAALLIPLSGCAEPTFTADDDTCRSALASADAVDAFEWLSQPSGGERRLGVLSTDEGLAFAHELQARGANAVTVFGVVKRPGPPPS